MTTTITSSLQKVPIKLRNICEMEYFEFKNVSSAQSSRNQLRESILQGDIYIIRGALSRTIATQLLKNITSYKTEKVNSTAIVEGVANIYYESKNYKKNDKEYTAIDKSWYFFPWNHDHFKLITKIQPIFDNVIKLNNKVPSEIIKLTPKDGLIQRFHLINYPINQGQISLHADPVNVSQINSGIYFTESGTHYKAGGFYAMDSYNNKVYVDEQVHVGDMVLFYPGILHGVDPIVPLLNAENSNGRFFLNMNLIQSHEIKNRLTTIGY